YFYWSIAVLDRPHAAFALGSGISDAALRGERVRALYETTGAFSQWQIKEYPFQPPPYDVAWLLARVHVNENGTVVGPASRKFWRRALDSTELPDDPARQLRNIEEDGTVDAAWLADTICVQNHERRRERMHRLLFGQRVFATAGLNELPDVLTSVRALTR